MKNLMHIINCMKKSSNLEKLDKELQDRWEKAIQDGTISSNKYYNGGSKNNVKRTSIKAVIKDFRTRGIPGTTVEREELRGIGFDWKG